MTNLCGINKWNSFIKSLWNGMKVVSRQMVNCLNWVFVELMDWSDVDLSLMSCSWYFPIKNVVQWSPSKRNPRNIQIKFDWQPPKNRNPIIFHISFLHTNSITHWVFHLTKPNKLNLTKGAIKKLKNFHIPPWEKPQNEQKKIPYKSTKLCKSNQKKIQIT